MSDQVSTRGRGTLLVAAPLVWFDSLALATWDVCERCGSVKVQVEAGWTYANGGEPGEGGEPYENAKPYCDDCGEVTDVCWGALVGEICSWCDGAHVFHAAGRCLFCGADVEINRETSDALGTDLIVEHERGCASRVVIS